MTRKNEKAYIVDIAVPCRRGRLYVVEWFASKHESQQTEKKTGDNVKRSHWGAGGKRQRIRTDI